MRDSAGAAPRLCVHAPLSARSQVVYYELEAPLLQRLYLPTPDAGRLRPALEPLVPMLADMRAVVAPRWSQRLLESVLATLAIAIAAVIELPDRRFAPRHKPMLDEDVDTLGTLCLRATVGVLEEKVVRAALAVLYALGEQACAAA